MGEFYYPMPIKPMFENFPISKFVHNSPLYYITASQNSNLNNSANLKKKNLKYFWWFIRAPDGVVLWKWTEVKNLDTVPLKASEMVLFANFTRRRLILISGHWFYAEWNSLSLSQHRVSFYIDWVNAEWASSSLNQWRVDVFILKSI